MSKNKVSYAKKVEIVRDYLDEMCIRDRVYVETCPHYLIFDSTILRSKKAFAKCTPPFRSRQSVDELWNYVFDGTIDVIGSDHGPFTDEEKTKEGDFWKEYCGCLLYTSRCV